MVREAGNIGAEAHVEEKLALYHLGELSDADAGPMRAHLADCAQCRVAQTEVVEVLGALASLTDERKTLLNVWGALDAAEPEAFPERFAPIDESEKPHALGWNRKRLKSAATKSVPVTPTVAPTPTPTLPLTPPDARVAEPVSVDATAPAFVSHSDRKPLETPDSLGKAKPAAEPVELTRAAKPAESTQVAKPVVKPVESTRVAKPVESTRAAAPAATPAVQQIPARKARSRKQNRTIAVTSCMLAGVIAFGGLAVSALVRGVPGENAPPAAALTIEASAADQDTGATMSVFLTESSQGVAVRATVNKLAKGTGYRLFAVGYDGNRWPVGNWTGTAGLQEVKGAVPATFADISLLTVLRSDRKTAVTVYLPRTAGVDIGPGGN